MHLSRLPILMLLVALLGMPAVADERILDFHSDIQILPDASLVLVTAAARRIAVARQAVVAAVEVAEDGKGKGKFYGKTPKREYLGWTSATDAHV